MIWPFTLVTKPIGLLISLISGILSLLLMLVLAAWLAAEFYVGPKLADHATQAGGLEVSIDGCRPLFLEAGLAMEDVRLMNPSGFPPEPMVLIRRLELGGEWQSVWDGESVQFERGLLHLSRISRLTGSGGANLVSLRDAFAPLLSGGAEGERLVAYGKPVSIGLLTVRIDAIEDGSLSNDSVRSQRKVINYEREFSDVVEWKSVLRLVCDDLRSAGHGSVAGELDPVFGEAGRAADAVDTVLGVFGL